MTTGDASTAPTPDESPHPQWSWPHQAPPAALPDLQVVTHHDEAVTHQHGNDTLESIADTVSYAARAIDGLRDVLAKLDESITRSQADAQAELQIGRLFADAQQYIDDVTAQAQARARQVVADAEREAATIVAAGAAEAQRLRDEAARVQVPSSEVMRQLRAAITGFSKVNQDLVDELTSWWQRLVVPGPTAAPPPSWTAPQVPQAPVPSVPETAPAEHPVMTQVGPSAQIDRSAQVHGAPVGRDLTADWAGAEARRLRRADHPRRITRYWRRSF